MNPVPNRRLGNSGLHVSALTFGTNTFGGRGIFEQVGATDAKRARRLVEICIDAGVNLFDCADEYSDGLAEEILGQAVTGHRDAVLLATKASLPNGPGPNARGWSRRHLIRACEASLRRLGTDHIDLFQLHAWDAQTSIEETVEALDTLVRAGKVRYVGTCNLSSWQLTKVLAAAGPGGRSWPVCEHIHYSPLVRDAEYELIPTAIDRGIGVLVWSPLAGGLLSGKHRRGLAAAAGSRIAAGWDEPPVRDPEHLFDLIEVLVEIGEGHGVSAAQVTLAWTLGRPGVSSLVVGARSEEQLRDNLAAAGLELAEEERARIDQLTLPPLLYPYWHQAKTVADRLGPADLALLSPYLSSGEEE